jgi:hypothetical protein
MTKTCPKCGAEMTQRLTKTGQKRGWNCAPCAAKRVHAYRRAEPDKWLDTKLWCFYRIRLVDYRRMLDEQGGRCKACQRVPSGTSGIDGTGLVIDHDHRCCPSSSDRWGPNGNRERICGKCIRGLLCTHCNVALGMVDEDPERLAALADYIHRTRNPDLRAAPAI